jgi:hypothetical protein
MEVSCQIYTPVALSSKKTGTHSIAGYMGATASQDCLTL